MCLFSEYLVIFYCSCKRDFFRVNHMMRKVYDVREGSFLNKQAKVFYII